MAEMKSQLQGLIAENKVDQALDKFLDIAVAQGDRDMQNTLILLKSRYTRNKQNEQMNLISFTDALREQSQISTALLDLVSRYQPTGDEATTPGVGNTPATGSTPTQPVILFLASNPVDAAKLQLEKEFGAVFRSLQDGTIPFSLKAEPAVQAGELQQAVLKHQPYAIHFAGHGVSANSKLPTGGIVLQDSSGQPQLVSGEALANMFKIMTRRIPIKLVLLNSCHSEDQAKGIAQTVDFVIGMSDTVPDNVAIEFAIGFYRALASQGDDVEFAFDLAVNQIQLQGITGDQIPVLYRKPVE